MLTSAMIAAAGVAVGVHVGKRRAKGDSWEDIIGGVANGARDYVRKAWRWLSGTTERPDRPISPEGPEGPGDPGNP